jgi:hypothetical protein
MEEKIPSRQDSGVDEGTIRMVLVELGRGWLLLLVSHMLYTIIREILYEKAEGEGCALLKTCNTMKGFL